MREVAKGSVPEAAAQVAPLLTHTDRIKLRDLGRHTWCAT